MEVLGYIGALLMGVSLGLIGGGGSILSVPIFVYLFQLPPTLATAYSLFVVGLTSAVGSASYMRRRLVNFRVGITFAIPAFIGVYLVRRYLLPALPDTVATLNAWTLSKDLLIMLVFTFIMLAASYSMIRGRSELKKRPEFSAPVRALIIGSEGLLVGGITGFVGAGGGFLIIPALVLLTGLPMKEAVGTSLMIIAAKSLIGFLGDVSTQAHINWLFLSQFSALAIVGIFAGSYASGLVRERGLKTAFGWFVLVMGAVILIQQVLGEV